jgi:hypothetical protein
LTAFLGRFLKREDIRNCSTIAGASRRTPPSYRQAAGLSSTQRCLIDTCLPTRYNLAHIEPAKRSNHRTKYCVKRIISDSGDIFDGQFAKEMKRPRCAVLAML